MNYQDWLREAHEDCGLTQADTATILQITRQQVKGWETVCR